MNTTAMSTECFLIFVFNASSLRWVNADYNVRYFGVLSSFCYKYLTIWAICDILICLCKAFIWPVTYCLALEENQIYACFALTPSKDVSWLAWWQIKHHKSWFRLVANEQIWPVWLQGRPFLPPITNHPSSVSASWSLWCLSDKCKYMLSWKRYCSMS